MSISNVQIDNLLEELLKLHPKKIDLSLDRIKILLNKLGNPQNKINNILHIAGTNGKYSTLRFIQEILRYNNKSTNAYISPHLVRFNERFELNDKQITNDDLFNLLNKIKNINEGSEITFFESTSGAFFEAASKSHTDYTLLEVGLGGRLDSSNVIEPLISIISSISFDHQDFLGNSIEKIAFEKSGIIKTKIPAIIGFQPYPEAKEMLINQAEHNEAPVFAHGIHWNITEQNGTLIYEDNTSTLEFSNFDDQNEFQKKNIGLAIAAISQLPNIEVREFLKDQKHKSIYFPGRMQKIEDGKLCSKMKPSNELYLDGSHNVDAAFNLNKTLKNLPEKKLCIIIGMINTKDPAAYIRQFSNCFSITTITIPSEENAIPADELKNKLKDQCAEIAVSSSISEAVKSINEANENTRILICGSLYLAGKVLEVN